MSVRDIAVRKALYYKRRNKSLRKAARPFKPSDLVWVYKVRAPGGSIRMACSPHADFAEGSKVFVRDKLGNIELAVVTVQMELQKTINLCKNISIQPILGTLHQLAEDWTDITSLTKKELGVSDDIIKLVRKGFSYDEIRAVVDKMEKIEKPI